jgi:transposase
VSHEISLWVGIDWATQEHQVCGVDKEGAKRFEWKVRHAGDDIGRFVARLIEEAGGRADAVAVAIETPRGSIVEALIERGVAAFSINPKQLDRFRDRHTVGGAKSDRLDAFVLADSLRTDLRLYRRIELGDPVAVELREMVRAHETLTADLLAAASRLREQLHRYFPQFLELGALHEEAWLWDLLELAPTPSHVAQLSRCQVEALLEQRRIRRVSPEQVLATLRQTPLVVAPGVVDAASSHVMLLLPLLRVMRAQLKSCDGRIKELMDRNSESDSSAASERKEHRDADILRSVPGLGTLTSATILAEASTALRDRDYQGLRSLAGVAPITSQTGKRKPTVSMRRACSPRVRNAVYHWARVSTQHDPHSREHYSRLRHTGKTHGRALRGVADRLLSMLIAMLKAGSLYDANRRTPAPG